MGRKKSKEGEYINNLEALVSSNYKRSRRNVEYSCKGFCGEIDYMGQLTDGSWDIYEVKSTSHPRAIKRANEQLFRIRLCKPYKINNLFIYVGKTKELTKYH